MIVCVPTSPDGQVGGSWGRADRVAVAGVAGGKIEKWDEIQVGWDVLHDEGGEGSHHARVAKFLMDNGVQCVVAGHMGPGMHQMLTKMGLKVVLAGPGDARAAVVAAAS